MHPSILRFSATLNIFRSRVWLLFALLFFLRLPHPNAVGWKSISKPGVRCDLEISEVSVLSVLSVLCFALIHWKSESCTTSSIRCHCSSWKSTWRTSLCTYTRPKRLLIVLIRLLKRFSGYWILTSWDSDHCRVEALSCELFVFCSYWVVQGCCQSEQKSENQEAACRMPLIRNDAAASQWLCAKTRGIQWQMVFVWPKSFKDLDIKAVPAVPILLPLEVFFETPRRSPGFQDSVGASRKDGMVIEKTDSIETLETLKQEYRRTHTSDVLFLLCACVSIVKPVDRRGKRRHRKLES